MVGITVLEQDTDGRSPRSSVPSSRTPEGTRAIRSPRFAGFWEAGDPGIEPGVAVLETTVLPIHQSPLNQNTHFCRHFWCFEKADPCRRGEDWGEADDATCHRRTSFPGPRIPVDIAPGPCACKRLIEARAAQMHLLRTPPQSGPAHAPLLLTAAHEDRAPQKTVGENTPPSTTGTKQHCR